MTKFLVACAITLAMLAGAVCVFPVVSPAYADAGGE